MNVIAITAYNKPDLLFLYLESIYKSDLSNYKIQIHTEEGFDTEEGDVVNFYKKEFPSTPIELIIKKKHPTCPLVGFHNILSSYLIASEEADEYVIIGEEDMLPTYDYVAFNEYCYQHYLSNLDRLFCVAHKRRPETELIGNPEILIGDYQCTSPSCISKRVVETYLRPIFNSSDYFSNPIKFNQNIFPYSRIAPDKHTHHDGALERIMEAFNLFTLKPDQARSMHVGLSGIFCKGTPPLGSLESKINQWRTLLDNGGDAVRALSTLPKDITVVPFTNKPWTRLILDTERVLAEASSWHYDSNNEFKKYIDESIF